MRFRVGAVDLSAGIYLSGQKGQPSTLAQMQARIHSMTTCGSCHLGTVLIGINISHLLGVVATVEKVIALGGHARERHPASVAVGKGAQPVSAIRRCSRVGSR
ncbi:hypothetical protein [Variovorax sp. HW608]|uniref:hypothetical protein n=1 Tax=Variovorax sp. HW608 TaxID=1034889 RepID=UPI000B5ADF63|nr:hypothetical protein [Variovorax sp. HW608]